MRKTERLKQAGGQGGGKAVGSLGAWWLASRVAFRVAHAAYACICMLLWWHVGLVWSWLLMYHATNLSSWSPQRISYLCILVCSVRAHGLAASLTYARPAIAAFNTNTNMPASNAMFIDRVNRYTCKMRSNSNLWKSVFRKIISGTEPKHRQCTGGCTRRKDNR